MADMVARIVRPAPLSSEKVLFAWRVAAGSVLARTTQVRLRADGCLLVQLQDERWRPEIERAVAVLRERMAAMLGGDVCREIRLAGGTASVPPRPRPSQPARGHQTRPSKAPATRKRRTR